MSSHHARTVYLNGQYLPIERAQISVMDRGFLFADGVYEVVPVFNGRMFRPHQHLLRLQAGLRAIHIDVDLDENEYLELFQELLLRNQNQGAQQAIYLQVTRGAALTRDHLFPAGVPATIFAQCTPLHSNAMELLEQGMRAITAPDIRWQWCYIKAVGLLPNVLFAQRAKEAGAHEAIWLRDGFALEGCSSNLFICTQGELHTPPLSPQILGGITRELILELAQQLHIPCREQPITEAQLRQADEVWMTGSVKEILPITHIDGQVIADGKVGPIWRRMKAQYEAFKQGF